MEKFFESNTDFDVEGVMREIRKKISSRKPLVTESPRETESFSDLRWKAKELIEKQNPIPVPESTRLRLAKRVISKVIRQYTRGQVHFNQTVVSFLTLLINHMERFSYYNDDVLHKIEMNESQIRELHEYITQIRDANFVYDAECKNYDALNVEQKRTIQDQTEQIINLRNWIQALEKSYKNLNDWVKVISEREELLERYQSRVRKELFAEMKFGGFQEGEKPHESFQTEILNQRKYNELLNSGRLKVNLGCGPSTFDDYLNIDLRPLDQVDVVADVKRLPLQEGTILELYLSHLIEHFSEVEMGKVILPYWYKLIAKGGKIRVICPNWEAMLKGYSDGEIGYETLKEVTFGSQEYEGNNHYNMFTPSTLTEMLTSAGFCNIEIVAESRQNGMCLEMEIEGEKPQ